MGRLARTPDIVLSCQRQDILDVGLIADVDRCLDDVDIIVPGRVGHGFIVSGIADESALAGIARLNKRTQRLTLFQGIQIAGVQQHDVEAVGLETLQRPINALFDPASRPVGTARVLAALRNQHIVIAAMANSLPDRLLRAIVGSRRVDQVDPAVEDRVDDVSDLLLVRVEVSHRSAAKSQHRYLQSRLAEGAHFHVLWSPFPVSR